MDVITRYIVFVLLCVSQISQIIAGVERSALITANVEGLFPLRGISGRNALW